MRRRLERFTLIFVLCWTSATLLIFLRLDERVSMQHQGPRVKAHGEDGILLSFKPQLATRQNFNDKREFLLNRLLQNKSKENEQWIFDTVSNMVEKFLYRIC